MDWDRFATEDSDDDKTARAKLKGARRVPLRASGAPPGDTADYAKARAARRCARVPVAQSTCARAGAADSPRCYVFMSFCYVLLRACRRSRRMSCCTRGFWC